MRWTRRCREASGTDANDETVWSWPPDAEVKPGAVAMSALTGRHAEMRKATVAIKLAHRGERGIGRKTTAQGAPDRSAYL